MLVSSFFLQLQAKKKKFINVGFQFFFATSSKKLKKKKLHQRWFPIFLQLQAKKKKKKKFPMF